MHELKHKTRNKYKRKQGLEPDNVVSDPVVLSPTSSINLSKFVNKLMFQFLLLQNTTDSLYPIGRFWELSVCDRVPGTAEWVIQ